MDHHLKTFAFLLVAISSSCFLLVSASSAGLTLTAATDPTCIQKLMPCQPFLKSASPPATCCAPLAEMVKSDVECLCSVFNNADLLKQFNVTQDEALKLPKVCGADPDLSLCNKHDDGTASPATPSNSSSPSDNNEGKKSGAANLVVYSGGISSLALFAVSFMLAAI